jgi:outer membrane receptor protein involved in Fe transport
LTWQHLSDIDSEASASQPTTTIQGAGAYDMFNLNASYNWENYSLRVGIDNLFDEDPETINNNPGIDSNSNSTNAGFYDTLGTRYYIGLKASF